MNERTITLHRLHRKLKLQQHEPPKKIGGGGELMCPGMVSSSCFNRNTRHIILDEGYPRKVSLVETYVFISMVSKQNTY